MTKTICDICGKEMPTEKFANIYSMNFCISSYGKKIWDICNECREDLNKWIKMHREEKEDKND